MHRYQEFRQKYRDKINVELASVIEEMTVELGLGK
jgi:hypothetical protein